MNVKLRYGTASELNVCQSSGIGNDVEVDTHGCVRDIHFEAEVSKHLWYVTGIDDILTVATCYCGIVAANVHVTSCGGNRGLDKCGHFENTLTGKENITIRVNTKRAVAAYWYDPQRI